MIIRNFNILFAAAAILLAGCDEVDINDRYIKLDDLTPTRKVLLEDFTGQYCSNCPDAHNIIDDLHKQYGEHLIAVSIHAGSFGESVTETDFSYPYVGLMTEQGEQLNNAYSIKAWPSGVVNGNSGVLNMNKWADAVRSAMEIETELSLDCDAWYLDGKITIEVRRHALMDIPDARLHVWLTEDSIHAFQQVGDEYVEDYVHNHVFRTSVTPIDGTPIELKAFNDYDPVVIDGIKPVYNDFERWNVANMHAVAFISTSAGVIQADSHIITLPLE